MKTPDCILGTFLVNSTPAIVLFYCGASHSFVTQKFAEKCGLEPSLLRGHMAIQTTEAVLRTKLGCRKVGIVINGTSFLADLNVLKSQGLKVFSAWIGWQSIKASWTVPTGPLP